MAKEPRTANLAIRLTEESKRRLEAAQTILPYAPSITAIVERGIVLATQEMEALAQLLKDRS